MGKNARRIGQGFGDRTPTPSHRTFLGLGFRHVLSIRLVLALEVSLEVTFVSIVLALSGDEIAPHRIEEPAVFPLHGQNNALASF